MEDTLKKYVLKTVAVFATSAVAILAGCDFQAGPSDPASAGSQQASSAQSQEAGPSHSKAKRLAAFKKIKAASKGARHLECESSTYNENGKEVVRKKGVRLSVINAKLGLLPEAQAALGFKKAATCTEARFFIDYMNRNPGLEERFDPYLDELQPMAASEDSSAIWSGPVPLKKASILGAAGSSDRQGIVEIDAWSGGKCTGVLLEKRTILTSAHCVYLLGAGDDFTADFTITYFDPWDGSTTPRVLANGGVQVHVHPPYSGDGDYQSDIAVLNVPVSWPDVDIYDNVRVYNGNPTNMNLVLWGRGFDAANGTGSGVLRYEPHAMNGNGTYYYYTRATGHRVCHGDSGGPAFRDDSNVNFTFGLLSGVSSFSGECASYDAMELGTKLYPKISWIKSAAGISCTSHMTSGLVPYIRCF